MTIEEIRQSMLVLIDTKQTNRTEIARATGLGYITIINVLNPDYQFEVKQNTLKKIENYLNAL